MGCVFLVSAFYMRIGTYITQAMLTAMTSLYVAPCESNPLVFLYTLSKIGPGVNSGALICNYSTFATFSLVVLILVFSRVLKCGPCPMWFLVVPCPGESLPGLQVAIFSAVWTLLHTISSFSLLWRKPCKATCWDFSAFFHRVQNGIFSIHLCWQFGGGGKIKLTKIHFWGWIPFLRAECGYGHSSILSCLFYSQHLLGMLKNQ